MPKNYPGSLTASIVISEALTISNRNSERHVRSIKRIACLLAIFDIYEMQDALNQHKFNITESRLLKSVAPEKWGTHDALRAQ